MHRFHVDLYHTIYITWITLQRYCCIRSEIFPSLIALKFTLLIERLKFGYTNIWRKHVDMLTIQTFTNTWSSKNDVVVWKWSSSKMPFLFIIYLIYFLLVSENRWWYFCCLIRLSWRYSYYDYDIHEMKVFHLFLQYFLIIK